MRPTITLADISRASGKEVFFPPPPLYPLRIGGLAERPATNAYSGLADDLRTLADWRNI